MEGVYGHIYVEGIMLECFPSKLIPGIGLQKPVFSLFLHHFLSTTMYSTLTTSWIGRKVLHIISFNVEFQFYPFRYGTLGIAL